MNNQKPSLKFVLIITITAIAPIILGTLIGVVLYSGTTNRANALASNSLSLTAHEELNTILSTETQLLDDFFANFETLIENIRNYLESLLEFPNIDSRWNLSLLSENQVGLRGLTSDMGYGDVFIFPPVEMNTTVNATIDYLSLGSSFFNSIVKDNSILHAYFSTENGVNWVYPFINALAFLDPNTTAKQRPWYEAGLQNNGSSWSIYTDAFTGNLTATVSTPFYNKSTFFGVVGLDISLATVETALTAFSYSDTSYAFLLNRSLAIISRSAVSPNDNGFDELVNSSKVNDISLPSLYQFLLQAFENKTGRTETVLRTGPTYSVKIPKILFYKSLETVDLLFCIVISKSDINIIAEAILELYNSSAGQFILSQVIAIIFIFFLAFLISFIGYGYGIRGIFRSRTRLTEAKLEKSEKDYQELFEDTPIGLYRSTPSGKFIAANKAFVQLLGASSFKELQKRNINDLTKELEYPRGDFEINLAGSKETVTIDNRIKRLDGSYIYIREHSKAVRNDDGSIQYFEGSMEDISKQRAAEFAKAVLEQKRSDFISMTTHELRTPLTAIKGFTEILERSSETDIKKNRRVQIYSLIKKNVFRLERLVQGVSELTRIEQEIFDLQRENFKLCDYLKNLIPLFETLLGHPIQMLQHSAKKSCWVYADKDRIEQILTNLIDNAIKHTPEDNRQISIEIEILQDVIQLKVMDNGCGISTENLEIIFDQFISLPTEYSVIGTGIGLYVSRLLAKAQGGALWAESEGIGQGSTFILEIPLLKGQIPSSD
ncbi:MAG: ATP-binding protein [Candidatus Hodarchaeales archaeon]